MTAPQPQFDPASLWDALVTHGLSEKDATRHVMLQLANQPEAVQHQYLKDVDPGKWASFGLGAADMMSFGLGDKVARLLEGKAATDTQQAAMQEHPTAHTAGEIAGFLGPAAAEVTAAKLGKLVPGIIGNAVRGIRNKPLQIAAKAALNTAVGAGLGAAQGAGRANTLPEALAQGKKGAVIGGLLGGGVPLAAQGIGEAVSPLSRYVGRVGNRLYTPPNVSSVENFSLLPAEPRAPPTVLPDVLDKPTFLRRRTIAQQVEALQPRATVNTQGLLAETPGKPGHPVWQGEGSPTRSVATEPLTPSPAATDPMRTLLRKQSTTKLRATLAKPETPTPVRQLIQIELKRRRA